MAPHIISKKENEKMRLLEKFEKLRKDLVKRIENKYEMIIDGLLKEDKEYKGIIDKLFEDKQKVLEELDNQCREQRQQIIDSFEVND